MVVSSIVTQNRCKSPNMRTERFFRKILVALCVLSTYLLYQTHDDNQRTLEEAVTSLATAEEQDKEEEEPKRRPIVKTFFQSLEDSSSTAPSHDPLLQVWKEEWEMAGFEAQILTMEDARKHPYYDKMREAVEKVFKTDPYNQYCFYRYLAMAVTGGGWHVDYDTIPANFPVRDAVFLPTNGKFTSHQRFVPALISSSEEEWSRVAKLLVEQIPKKNEEDGNSDMYMLMELEDEGNHDIDSTEKVASARDVVAGKRSINCKVMNHSFAVHFSHSAMMGLYNKGAYPLDVKSPNEAKSSANRAKAIKMIMEDYRDQCQKSDTKK